jgi:uncharacterized protein (TIGR03435 family)
MNTCLASAIALAAISALAAQNAPNQPKFEVASVKRVEGGDIKTSLDPGILTLKGLPLKAALSQAFQVPMDQIAGPAWLDEDCFDIIARMPEGATKDQIPAMLQALLAERFKLAAHKESHPRQGYAMVVDKNGPKFKEAEKPKDTGAFSGRLATSGDGRVIMLGRRNAVGRVAFKGPMGMASVARILSDKLGGPVQDLTGLEGEYQIDFDWTPDPGSVPATADSASTPTGSLVTAVRQILGLRLERRDARVETLVIDHIERVPAEN